MRGDICLAKIETTNKLRWNPLRCNMGLPGLIISSRAHQLLREIHCLRLLVRLEIQTTRDTQLKIRVISTPSRAKSTKETTIWTIRILSIWDISTWWILSIIICKPILQVSPRQHLDKRGKMKIMASNMELPKSCMKSLIILNLVSSKKTKDRMLSEVWRNRPDSSRMVMSSSILSNRDFWNLLLLASIRFLRQLLPLHHYLRRLTIIEPYSWTQVFEKRSLTP